MITVVDTKQQAELARDFLKSKKNIEISENDSMDLIAFIYGFDCWQSLSDHLSLIYDLEI